MIRWVAFVLFAFTLFACWPVVAQQSTLAHSRVTTTERLPFEPGGAIRLNHSYGDLTIEGWDHPEVEITMIKSLPYGLKERHPGENMRRIEGVKIVTRRASGNELEISTNLPASAGLLRRFRSTVAIEYRIHVPRSSTLAIDHGTGSVLVSDVTGDIDATCHRCDIMLMLPDSGTYSIDAQSKLGTVISDFEGTPQIRKYRLGERYNFALAGSSRKLFLRVGFGGITLKALPPEADPTGKTK
jgi:hypothetical protein